MTVIHGAHAVTQIIVPSDNPVKTAFLTLFGGVILFMLSEALRGFTIKPTIKLRELRGTIIDRVIFHQGHLLSGGVPDADTQSAISTELRSMATQYRAAM